MIDEEIKVEIYSNSIPFKLAVVDMEERIRIFMLVKFFKRRAANPFPNQFLFL